MEYEGVKINDFTKEQIDALYPNALMIMPMKVWTLPKTKKHMKEEVLSEGKYVGQLKKDGYYYSYEKHENNSYLFSKSVSKKTGLLSEKINNVPHIKEILNKHLPLETVLIGEICSRKGGSNEVTKIMGCLSPKAIQRQNADPESKLYFYVHDIAVFNGVNCLELSTLDRLSTIDLLKYKFEKEATEEEKMFVEFAETRYEGLGDMLSDAFADDEEGIVLKLKTGKIIPNKRPAWNTIKFKKEMDPFDVVCMGYEPPKVNYTGTQPETWEYWFDGPSNDFLSIGNYSHVPEDYGYARVTKAFYLGWIGSIRVGAYDENGELQYIGRVSSGLTENLLRAIADDQEKFIGMPLVIGAMEPGIGDNTLRHLWLNSKIGFYGFRDDIDATDCTMNKIFN